MPNLRRWPVRIVLEAARPVELGEAAEFTPIYVRGFAYLRAKDGTNACRELQKFLDQTCFCDF